MSGEPPIFDTRAARHRIFDVMKLEWDGATLRSDGIPIAQPDGRVALSLEILEHVLGADDVTPAMVVEFADQVLARLPDYFTMLSDAVETWRRLRT